MVPWTHSARSHAVMLVSSSAARTSGLWVMCSSRLVSQIQWRLSGRAARAGRSFFVFNHYEHHEGYRPRGPRNGPKEYNPHYQQGHPEVGMR